ncbi:MAG: glycosyltransferase [Burkholderiales bacterium]|nr:glycosyltransferase [Burkholderiales bacterium]
MTVLYMTQNGVTDHIGRSQVAPYVLSLARQGFRLHVLSAEKPGQDTLIDKYQQLFDDVGILWTRVRYRNKPQLVGQAFTQVAMRLAAHRIVRQEGIRLIHCRSFPPAVIGHGLKRALGVKYIFDFRDFYVDGGLENRRGLARLAFRRLKRLEGPMIRDADKVVCLTDRAREVLSGWYLSDVHQPERRFRVIPCCADFTHFDAARLTAADLARAREKAGLQPGEFVLLYLGSLGPDYLLPQMVALFRQVLTVQSRARFLFASNNGKELVEAECDAQGVARDAVRFLSADREEIPALIALADLSVVFIRAARSKAGCSPAKLAELFACNVPVIANTGVGDLDNIISLQRNGSVIVHDFSEETLRAAVQQVIRFNETSTVSIRENSREFALEEGVARYAAVYRELLNE